MQFKFTGIILLLFCFMLRLVLLVWGVACAVVALAQSPSVKVKILSPAQTPLAHASVELLKTDSSLHKISVSDSAGFVDFTEGLSQPAYILRVSRVGYVTVTKSTAPSSQRQVVILQPYTNTLDSLTIRTQKAFVEVSPGKTVVNVDAAISNTGATVMETLARLPGVSVDREGNISLKGRAGVRVFFDGKPTYLNAGELSALLNGMNASQLSQVELMDVPPARFDADGNAGVINLKFKKNLVRGFNGTLGANFSRGRYSRTNDNLLLNFRSGRYNLFFNYGFNASEGFSRLYTVRTYTYPNGSFASQLEQPGRQFYDVVTNSLRTGIDYTVSKKTSLGLTLAGTFSNRTGWGNNQAYVKRNYFDVDSVIRTQNRVSENWRHYIASANLRHRFSEARELSVDADAINYHITRSQSVDQRAVAPATYFESIQASIPTDIQIYSAKADYTEKLKSADLGFGWKFSKTNTDNLADYKYFDGIIWQNDAGRSNHFLYNESIQALYATLQTKGQRFSVQAGLRYEATAYHARQLAKDSAFSRRYNSLFPTLYLSYEKDTANSFTASLGRRITRPYFQKLNPFLFIINKYTYQQGNPYFLPEFSWNAELSHVYKNLLITSLTYSLTTDYHAQIFPEINQGVVLYTEGNLGRLQIFGASVTVQHGPTNWWSFSLQTLVNYKKMNGVIVGNFTTADITQYTVNATNQLHFKKGWSGEVSAFYNSKSQHDLQETVDPYGQLTLGLAKTVAQNKGTIKLTVRDVFFTNRMRGLTYFNRATETFNLATDSRYGQLSFVWRFGQSFKTAKRSEGAAADELQRIGGE